MNRLVFLKVNINQAPNAELELNILEMQLKWKKRKKLYPFFWYFAVCLLSLLFLRP